uniref:Uncharacterized protein n=1 Tax=Ditylenchus dipsaci TaxID=166011 RepID=A0A915CT50_9BILA
MFRLTIDQHLSMAAVEKMTHLRSLLENEAKEFVAGLSIQEDNYKVALDLLLAKYGNTEAVIGDLYQQLGSLRPCSSFEEIQKFLLKVEKIIRLLKNNRQEVEALQSTSHSSRNSLTTFRPESS